MFDKKIDVDRHVESCLKKISSQRERNVRSFAFAKLYFNIGEFEMARRYVSSYLSVKSNSAEAHQLLGKIYEKLGRRDTALEEYQTSLDLDSKQSALIIKVCELLADDETLEPVKARYWCEQAQLLDPQNQAVFNLKERLIASKNNSPEELRKLFLTELEHRPTDVNLRVRLLNHLLQNNQITEAYKHVAEIEKKNLSIFTHHFAWYETLTKVLVRYKNDNLNSNVLKWDFWVLIVSVLDKLAMLSLDENSSTIRPISECISNVFNLDQMLQIASKNLAGNTLEKQFIQEFFIHYKAQLSFHICTLVFKQAKKDQVTYKEAINLVLPLLLLSYHAQPPDTQSVWLDHADDSIKEQIQRMHCEASYRCSQTGHILLAVAKGRRSNFVDRVQQLCSGSWREKTFKNIFITRDQQLNIKTSYFVNVFSDDIIIKLPVSSELFQYDEAAQLLYPDSLHHMIWIGLNNQPAKFHCTVFDGLQYSIKNLNNCAAETLNILDIEAFIYCCVFCAQSQIEDSKHLIYYNQDKPTILPANITELLGTRQQFKWFSYVYKMFKNESGSDVSDIRVTLIKGIEIVRCVGAHGLDVKLLVLLANTFSQKIKQLTKPTEIEQTELRAEVYWKAALPLLDKLRNNQAITYPSKRWFEYRGKEMTPTEINMHIEEGKLFSAVQLMKKKSHEKALQMLENLKNPYASYYQYQIYHLLADEQMSHNKENVTSEMRSQYIILMSRARDCLYLTLDRLREPSIDKKHPLNSQLGTEIEKIERLLSRIDPDICGNRNDCDGMSDENVSSVGSVGDHAHINASYINHTSFVNGNLTPRNNTLNTNPYFNFDTTLNLSRRVEARPSPERLDAQLRQMAATKDAAVTHILEQNKMMVESHRNLVDELRSFKDAVTNLTSSVEELKGIRKSVDELKDAVDDLQNLKEAVEQVYEIKKDLAELKKDTNKLKTTQINDEDLYALEEEYGVDYNIVGNAAGFNSAALYSNFPQRLQGANALGYPAPGLYGMYPMYPYGSLGLGQPGTLPFPEGQIPDFRSVGSIAQGLSHAGLTQPQVSLAQAGLTNMFGKFDNVAPFTTGTQGLPQRPVTTVLPQSYPVINPVATMPNLSVVSTVNAATSVTTSSIPVNVVITASDPLPTTSASQPILSVTIPPQHLKGNQQIKKQPHNYQIPLPATAQPSFAAVSAAITSVPLPVATQNLLSNVAPPIFSSLTVKSPVHHNNSNTAIGLDNCATKLNMSQQSVDKDHNNSNVSEHSGVEEHDPCPDFKPIIPLPDEVSVTTGEENEIELFCERAKLYRFVEKEWRERGIGNLKLLHNKEAKTVRVLMRREVVHKICANHILQPEMVLTPMANNDRAYTWAANDFADESIVLEKFCVRFKTAEIANKFFEAFNKAKILGKEKPTQAESKTVADKPKNSEILAHLKSTPKINDSPGNSLGGFVFTSTPTFKPKTDIKEPEKPQPSIVKASPFASFTFEPKTVDKSVSEFKPVQKQTDVSKETPKSQTKILNTSDTHEDDFVPTAEFKPVIALPDLVEVKTGEENSVVIHEVKAKLLRFDSDAKEWKERGVGIMKILKEKTIRLVMRREQVHKVCCNHQLLKNMDFKNMPKNNRVLNWCAQDFSENVIKTEMFAIKFKTAEVCDEFLKAIRNAQAMLDASSCVIQAPVFKVQEKQTWECYSCRMQNDLKFDKCISCSSAKDKCDAQSPQKFKPSPAPLSSSFGEKFKQKLGTWECKICYVHNDGKNHYCEACDSPKNNSIPAKDGEENVAGEQFSFTVSPNVSFNQSWDPAQFKPKPDAWTCNTCYVSNDKEASQCVACNTSKDGTSEVKGLFSVVNKIGTPSQGFGDKFKPKEGTWDCKSCYVNNKSAALMCVACNTPKEGGKVTGFGDQFKIKEGAWNCKACYINNKTDSENCATCNCSKDGNEKGVPVSIGISHIGSQVSSTVTTAFSFGIKPAATSMTSSWGDQFKPKEGSWDCKACYINNKPEDLYCIACNSPKDDTVPKKSQGIDLSTTGESKFIFGKPAATNEPVFGGKSAGFSFGAPQTEFSFGIPQDKANEKKDSAVDAAAKPTFSFGINVDKSKSEPQNEQKQTPLDLTPKNSFSFALNAEKPKSDNLEPKKEDFVFGSPNKYTFDFKPRSPRKASGGDGEDSDGSFVEDDGDHIYFKPVIPLPDKIEVKTGEEDEEVLYSHRAKLFRFVDAEWKERGLGDIKILKHKVTGKLRIVMRREQVLKICLNHALTKDIDYKAKDDRTWLFTCGDYSEGELSYEKFCIRFKNGEIAQEFKAAINKACDQTVQASGAKDTPSSADDDDCVIVYELKVTPEEEKKALDLMLPKNFYAYLQKPPCKGCIGCNPDEYVFPTLKTSQVKPVNVQDKSENSVSGNTITKPSTTTSSIIGASTNNTFSFGAGNKTIASVFGSPITSQETTQNTPGATNKSPIAPSKLGNISTGAFSFAKEGQKSIFGGSPTIFGGTPSSDKTTTSLFGTPQTDKTVGSIFGGTGQTDKTSSSLFGTPASGSIFGGTPTSEKNVTSIFGSTTSDNRGTSIFGQITQTEKPVGFSTPKTESKPASGTIFGGTPQTSVLNSTENKTTIFGGDKPSLFGVPPTSGTTSIFGSKTENKSVFGSQTGSIFGSSSIFSGSKPDSGQTSIFGGKTEEKGSVFGGASGPSFGTGSTFAQVASQNKGPVLKCDSSLSFAALASEAQTFAKQEETKPFMFDGAGTPVFGSKKPSVTTPATSGATSTPVTSTNDEEGDAHNETDDNYDPHYEPIVPLPDAIVVKTGEEDEQVLFIERAKLYRFNSEGGNAEWKERGVGMMKILHHPQNGTYRFLLRREQVHKLVLNQLLTPDLDLQPMQTSDRAWLWGGYNYTEDGASLEKLAVKFKNPDIAQQFYKAVEKILEELKNRSHVESSEQDDTEGDVDEEGEEQAEEEEYNSDESDETRSTMFSKRCTLSMKEGNDWKLLGMGVLKIYYDSDLYGSRIVMYDDNDVELSNTIIAVNTVMKVKDTTCIWRAMEWSLDPAIPRILKAHFSSTAAAEEMNYNFKESLQYAQECEIVDNLPDDVVDIF